jgi:hypothetical protein
MAAWRAAEWADSKVVQLVAASAAQWVVLRGGPMVVSWVDLTAAQKAVSTAASKVVLRAVNWGMQWVVLMG